MRLLACLFFAAALAAQSNTTPATHDAPQSPNDLKTNPSRVQPQGEEEFVRELYATISGPAGQKRDPDRFRNLFVKNLGRLVVIYKDPKTGQIGTRLLQPDDYIEKSFPYLEKNGFFEDEVARRTERYGNMMHIWSTYESRHKPGEQPFQRGINSIQLTNDGSGWKIIEIAWQGETPDNPLPEQYLHSH
jgi:hypothetical protein